MPIYDCVKVLIIGTSFKGSALLGAFSIEPSTQNVVKIAYMSGSISPDNGARQLLHLSRQQTASLSTNTNNSTITNQSVRSLAICKNPKSYLTTNDEQKLQFSPKL